MSAAASLTTLWPALVAGIVAGYAVALPVQPVEGPLRVASAIVLMVLAAGPWL
ncbi:hypothetical protein [Promicromonospora panici]|uniref:hypothetical protein n=1 Tax=Promicromonospora panici TaxID=2219658 RepID=UPI001A92E8AE|nr:hypothetical protein [Promicromonospora panici]